MACIRAPLTNTFVVLSYEIDSGQGDVSGTSSVGSIETVSLIKTNDVTTQVRVYVVEKYDVIVLGTVVVSGIGWDLRPQASVGLNPVLMTSK